MRNPAFALGCCQLLLAAAVAWTAYTLAGGYLYVAAAINAAVALAGLGLAGFVSTESPEAAPGKSPRGYVALVQCRQGGFANLTMMLA